MILLQQIRRFFLAMGLTATIAVILAFGSGSAESWATTLPTQPIPQPQAQIAAMNRAEAITKSIQDKAQAVVESINGDPKDQSAEVTKQSETETQEGINNSIVNPNYQPDGRSKQAAKEDHDATADLEAQVRGTFNK